MIALCQRTGRSAVVIQAEEKSGTFAKRLGSICKALLRLDGPTHKILRKCLMSLFSTTLGIVTWEGHKISIMFGGCFKNV